MSRSRVAVLAAAIVCLASPSHAQPADPPLVNWTAPSSWTPGTGHQAATSSGMTRSVSTQGTAGGPPLPFVAVTPCRLYDSRANAPFTGDSTFASNGNTEQLDFYAASTTPYAASGNPNGCTLPLVGTAGAWSLKFTYRTSSAAQGVLTAFPGNLTSVPGVGTILGYTDRFNSGSAIVPAGTDGDTTVKVWAQYAAAAVVIDYNGYFARQPVVTTLNTLSGDVTLAAGSNVTITPSSNTLTIAATGGPGGVLPTGATAQTLFWNSSAWTASSALTNNGTNVGVSGILDLPNASTSTSYIALGGSRFIHNYGPVNGYNTFLGVNAGNFSTSGFSNTGAGFISLSHNTSGTANSAIGSGTLFFNTTGGNNTAGGYESLYSNTVGSDNTALGPYSLFGNKTANKNTAVGSGALQSLSYDAGGNAWDSWNTAVGYQALFNDQPDNTIDGNSNTALGAQSLYSNTTGAYNTASGLKSLYSNTVGHYNTASGYGGLKSNTAGLRNTATGASSLEQNTTAGENTAVGAQALELQSYDNSGNPWHSFNTAVGYSALYHNQPDATTDGISNTAVGAWGLGLNTIGGYNTAIGFRAGASTDSVTNYARTGSVNFVPSTTGSNDTFLGYRTGATVDPVNNCTAVGVDAYCTGDNQVVLGNTWVGSIGGEVPWSNLSDIRAKTNVRDISLGLAFVMQLRPVEYQLRAGNGRTDMGFVAQDIEALLGDGYNVLGIGGDPERTLMLRYTDLMAPMVKAIQEQQATIVAQQAEIEALRAKVAEGDAQRADLEAITARLAALEKAVAAMR